MSDTLATVLAAAERLLAAGGPDALTMDTLAREAGVSRATLYRLIGGRDQLLARLGAGGEAADVRGRILEAAGVVFGRVGLESATIELVAREANVGPATIYRQFGGKDGLVSAFAAAFTERRRAAVAVPLTDDVHGDVTRAARAILGIIYEERALLRLVIGDACRDGSSILALRQRPARTSEAIAAVLAHHMAAGRLRKLDPVACAKSLFGMLAAHGFLNPILEGVAPPDPDGIVAHVVPLFLDGLSPTRTGGAS